MDKKLLIHAWQVEKKAGDYYLPYSHWIYLKEIVKYYDEIVLLAACKKLNGIDSVKSLKINLLGNISVYELPLGSGGYIGSLKHFFSYLKAYRKISEVSAYYARYPTPFGWLQKIYGKNKHRVIHYVGDPVDAAINNPNFSFLKKKVLINGFFLENYLYDWACKGALVFTNGHHLSDKLNKKGINAVSLISSTLIESDFYFSDKTISPETAKFIYLGYLRTAKGLETIVKAFRLYNIQYPDSTFTIIGSGEFEAKLREIISKNNIKNIIFLGQINDRNLINSELRAADIFLFGSLSEGSPRVILEAMANGLTVISTPVGNLPREFKDGENIIFSEFNDSNDFFEKMVSLTNDNKKYDSIRRTSYQKVKALTIENFLRKIFHE